MSYQVMLGPDEQFTQLSLSAGNPKKANMWKAIALFLSPIFTSDLIVVETSVFRFYDVKFCNPFH